MEIFWFRFKQTISYFSIRIKSKFVKLKIDKIPEGCYCYSHIEGNDPFEELRNTGSYSITPCPYYKRVGNKMYGCAYMGYITDDFMFADQIKSCRIKFNCQY